MVMTPVNINNQALTLLRKKFDQDTGRRQLLSENLESAKSSLEKNLLEYENTVKARAIVQAVAKTTQEKIQVNIGNMVSLALAAVFPDPYTFSLRFVERRNSTEADLIFSKGENETDDILNSSGGGVADVASFALRIALWNLKKTRATFILDEPGKFVSRDLQPKLSELLKELSVKLGIQIIMVSHVPELCNAADKIIQIENKSGISEVLC